MSRHSKGEVNRAGARLAHGAQASGLETHRWLDGLAEPQDLEARAVVEWWVGQHVQPMLEVHGVVHDLAPAVDLDGLELKLVTFRPKRLATIVEKLMREPGNLSQMVDLGGVRAVVETMDDVDHLASAIGARLSVTRAKDWARAPRASGYRALHLYVRHGERNIEVQLRTRGQDMWANLVEQESILSGLDYKSGRGHPEVLEFLALLAALIATIELGESHPELPERLIAAARRAKPLFHVPAFARMQL